MHPSWISALGVVLGGLSLSGGGEASPESVCKRLIPPIAKEVGVPVSLLKAIAHVESGYQPYALNHQGKSLSFKTPGEAFAYVEKQVKSGDTALDIGCMQIHWKAHQSAIEDPQKLLNPAFNIRYAAKFLKGLYQELGTWSRAVSAYHSRTGKGQAYLIKISTYLKKERYVHDQNPISTLSSRSLPVYGAHWPLVRLPLSYAGFSSSLSSKSLLALHGHSVSGSVPCSVLSPLVPN
jgi:hypothetical protein